MTAPNKQSSFEHLAILYAKSDKVEAACQLAKETFQNALKETIRTTPELRGGQADVKQLTDEAVELEKQIAAAEKALKTAVSADYKAAPEKGKTFCNGLAKIRTLKNRVKRWNPREAAHLGKKLIADNPALLPMLFEPKKSGWVKLAKDDDMDIDTSKAIDLTDQIQVALSRNRDAFVKALKQDGIEIEVDIERASSK